MKNWRWCTRWKRCRTISRNTYSVTRVALSRWQSCIFTLDCRAKMFPRTTFFGSFHPLHCSMMLQSQKTLWVCQQYVVVSPTILQVSLWCNLVRAYVTRRSSSEAAMSLLCLVVQRWHGTKTVSSWVVAGLLLFFPPLLCPMQRLYPSFGLCNDLEKEGGKLQLRGYVLGSGRKCVFSATRSIGLSDLLFLPWTQTAIFFKLWKEKKSHAHEEGDDKRQRQDKYECLPTNRPFYRSMLQGTNVFFALKRVV